MSPAAIAAACVTLGAMLALAVFATTQAASTAVPNLALGRPAFSSSNQSTSLTPNLAVDGNASTRWSSKFSNPQWIYVDLGQSYAINRVVLNWETAYGKAYQIQVSDDATNWMTIYSTTTSAGGTNDLAVAGSGRYVRMYGTTRGTSWGYSLWEFQVYGTASATIQPISTATVVASTPVPTAIPTSTPAPAPAVNLAFSRPATSSSNESASLTPNLAIDGNTSTRWSSKWGDPQWIQVDLGQTFAINRVLLKWEIAYGKSYQVQISNDGATWTPVYSTTSGDGNTDDLTVSGIGRYVRMYGTARATSWGYSLWEFSVYGTSTQAQLPLATATPTSTTNPAATATPVATSTPAPAATSTPVPTATAAPPTPTSTPSNGTAPLGASGTWNLAFADEFNGTSLDTSKWVTCYPWFSPSTGCTNAGNNELQWYMPSGVSVGNGELRLTATKQSRVGTNGKTYPYTSGMVSTGASGSTPPKFSYQYGFIEARMKMPPGRGLWPAFWTLPNDRSWPPEVDAMEFWGQNASQIMLNYHWKDSSGANQQAPSMVQGSFSTAWHTIGMNWQPGSLTWYVDGVVKKTLSNPYVAAKPMYIILNLAIDGGSAPDSSVSFPATYEVDYVRAWTK